MKFEDAAKRISPEIYENFKQALELGKWPDGRALSKEQKEICLQTVMLYEAEHGVPDEQRVGYIDNSKKKKPDDEQPIRVLH